MRLRGRMRNPLFDRVTRCGKATFASAGEKWFPELETLYLLQSTQRPEYDNLNNPRLRRHLLMYAKKGYLKSSISSYFFDVLCDPITIGEKRLGVDPQQPVVFNLSGEQSWARARGTVENGEIVTPYLAQADFVYASELLASVSFGQGGDHRGSISDWNRALEEGVMEVGLAKMTKADQDEVELKRSLWRDEGLDIEWNDHNHLLKFDVRSSMVACSHMLDDGTRKKMEQSGFWDRFHVARWEPSIKVIRHMQKEGFGERHPLSDEILEFNREAWKYSWGYIPWPPQEYVSDVMDEFIMVYDDMIETFGIEPHELASMRDAVTVAQQLTAAAIGRTLWERDGGGYYIDELEYTDADRDFVRSYYQNRLADMYDDFMGRADNPDRLKRNFNLLMTFLEREKSPRFEGKDLCNFITAHQDVHESTAYRYMNQMQEMGWFSSLKHGEYIASDQIKRQLDPTQMDDGGASYHFTEVVDLMED